MNNIIDKQENVCYILFINKKQLSKGGIYMTVEKIETITRTANTYKKLPDENQMFVLGYMQGVLSVLNGKRKLEIKQRGGTEGGE